jgi:hypothetical protein
VSPELFRANIRVLADLVQKKAQVRAPEAQTAYNIRGSNSTMEVDFTIRSDKGDDNSVITYQSGAVGFMMLY